MTNNPSKISRRRFMKSASVASVAIAAAPSILTAKKTDSATIIGEGEFKYEVQHAWPQLPAEFSWQTTHNVAVDSENRLYVIHEGHVNKKDHPSIFVFDSEGKYIFSFGSEFQGGGHGIEVRNEGGQEFLYICGYQQVKSFAKFDLKGNRVWQKWAPMESDKYTTGEALNPAKVWGRDRFMPTNFAFLPDGDFFLADGYGSFFVHRYDSEGNWKSCFGGPGNGEGTFNTPHGIWIDDRPGREPSIVVTDRAHHTLQYFSIEGEYLETLTGYGLPANCDTFGDLLIVPELHARVTLLGKDNKVVARLGDDATRIKTVNGIRADESKWIDGKFVHPHDACFDNDGNIFVAEWVGTGRVSRLKKVT